MTLRLSALRISVTALLLVVFSPPATRAQEVKPETPKIIRKSGGVLQASAINRVEPVFPPLAKAARISGAVVVEVTVGEDGNVVAARAVSGHPLLKDAAVDAARGWKFRQTMLSDEPVKVIGTITFNFVAGEKTPMDYDSIIEQLKNAIARDPSSSQTHHMLGVVYAENNQYEEAAEEFKEALRLLQAAPDAEKSDQKNRTYLDSLGWAYFKVGKLDEAEYYLSEAASIDPSLAIVQEHLGDLYQSKGRPEEARRRWQKALSLSDQPEQSRRLKAKLGGDEKK